MREKRYDSRHDMGYVLVLLICTYLEWTQTFFRNGDVGGLPVLVENSLVLQDVLDARLGEVGSMNSFCR